MSRNLELKIKIQNYENMKNKILARGSKFEEILDQKDTYFSFEKGLLKLREQNEKFSIIKYLRNEDNSDRWSDYSILNIEGKNVKNFFSDILNVETIVEKKRELFLYKNTRIHLDKVNGLGNYLELETVVKNISEQEAKDEYYEIIELLQLDLLNEIKKSYKDLILES